jgi:hypothetical protein
MRNTEGREGMLIILVTSCSSSPRSYSENNLLKKAEKYYLQVPTKNFKMR